MALSHPYQAHLSHLPQTKMSSLPTSMPAPSCSLPSQNFTTKTSTSDSSLNHADSSKTPRKQSHSLSAFTNGRLQKINPLTSFPGILASTTTPATLPSNLRMLPHPSQLSPRQEYAFQKSSFQTPLRSTSAQNLPVISFKISMNRLTFTRSSSRLTMLA